MPLLIIAGTLLFFSTCAAFSQSDKSDSSESQKALETLVLSYDLAAYGRKMQDPEAMLLAARLYKSVPVSKADFGGLISIPSERTKNDLPPSPVDAYLDQAEEFAGGNEYLLSQVDALRALEQKEVIANDYAAGPLKHGRWLKPGAVWQFEILVSNREPVMLAAIGDGDSVIEMEVINERGEVTASAPAFDARPVVKWQPDYESRFAVNVSNLGSVETYVAVYSN